MLLLFLAQFLVVIFVKWDFVLAIIGSVSAVLLFHLIYEMWNRQSQSAVDPPLAWLGRWSVQVWVKLNGEYFIVRLPGKKETYQPTKLEWVTDRSFNLTQGEISFQLEFANPGDASRIAAMIKNKFLQPTTA